MTLPDVAFLRHMLDAIDRIDEAVSRSSLEDFKRNWESKTRSPANSRSSERRREESRSSW